MKIKWVLGGILAFFYFSKYFTLFKLTKKAKYLENCTIWLAQVFTYSQLSYMFKNYRLVELRRAAFKLSKKVSDIEYLKSLDKQSVGYSLYLFRYNQSFTQKDFINFITTITWKNPKAEGYSTCLRILTDTLHDILHSVLEKGVSIKEEKVVTFFTGKHTCNKGLMLIPLLLEDNSFIDDGKRLDLNQADTWLEMNKHDFIGMI